MQSKFKVVNSVIDLGTNTCLLLVASAENNQISTLYEAQEIPRIGKDLYETGRISDECFGKVSEIFKKYISVSEKYNAKKIYAFGTSALRDAANGKEFIGFIKDRTGIEIKIISGTEEAKYSFEGALFDLGKPDEYAVIDIGGGSTELSFLSKGKIDSFSMDIGSVRLYELFLKEEISSESLSNTGKFIRDNLNKAEFRIPDNKNLAGVAGTITTLSAIKNNLKDFEFNVIHKDIMTKEEIENLFSKLIHMTKDERLNIGSYMKGRSDIIITGALILLEIMNRYKFDSLIVSAKGLRYGLMLNLEEFNK